MIDQRPHYVSRSAHKLIAAVDQFRVDPAACVCADLGCNIGGFTQVLLERGAARVYAVDTGYGMLDYRLRKDPRVVVMERTNALHVTLAESCALITIDIGWTRQKHALPAARKLLAPAGRIITLIKPHYEAPPDWLRGGVLDGPRRSIVLDTVAATVLQMGFRVQARLDSPVPGQAGNMEQLWLVEPA